MPGNPREMIMLAERRFPVRIRVGVPSEGLGQRHTQMTAWLDENCGADGWTMAPSGTRGVLNDALSIYFADATLASAFVARCASGQRSRRPEVCSTCAKISRSRASGRGCIGRRESEAAIDAGACRRSPEGAQRENPGGHWGFRNGRSRNWGTVNHLFICSMQ
jgi:hypothetical protein